MADSDHFGERSRCSWFAAAFTMNARHRLQVTEPPSRVLLTRLVPRPVSAASVHCRHAAKPDSFVIFHRPSHHERPPAK